MQVFTHELHEVGVDLVATLAHACFFGERAHRAKYLLHILSLKQVGHFTRVEDVVHVFKHGFLDDLCVGEKKHCRLVLATCREHERLDVLMPRHHIISPRDLNTKAFHIPQRRGQAHK